MRYLMDFTNMSPSAIPLALSIVLLTGLFNSEAMAANPLALDYYHQAVKQERAGELDEAIRLLKKAVNLEPYDQLNHIKLAALHARLGHTKEAIALYQKALQLGSRDPMIYFSLGTVYEQADNYTKAEEVYILGLKNNPAYQFGLFHLGRAQAQQGKFALAIQQYEKFLQAYPNHYDSRRHLAHLYMVTQAEENAVQQYDVLKNKFPERFTDHLALAKALNRSNEPDKALKELKLAYAKDGDKADIAEEMGNAHVVLGQLRYAIQNYSKALELAPGNPALSIKLAELYVTDQQPELSIKHYKTYLNEYPNDSNARKALTHVYLKTKKYPEAITLLKTQIQNLPKETGVDKRYQLEKQLAFSYQMNKNLPTAIQHYEGLLNSELGRGDVQLQKNLAIAYHETNALEKAIPLYRGVYTSDPKHYGTLGNDLANALVHVGDLMFKQQNLNGALTQYEEAQKYVKKDNISPLIGMARVHWEHRLDPHYPEASEAAYDTYRKILKQRPDDERALVGLARLDFEKGAIEKALSRLGPFAQINTTRPAVFIAMADIYQANGNTAQAVTTYERALSLQSDNDTLMIELGRLWQELGNPNESLKWFEQARKSNPNNAMAHYNLGVLYGETGRLIESEVAYQKTLALAPQFENALYGLAVTQEKQKKFRDALASYERYTTYQEGGYLAEAKARIAILREQLKATPEKSEQPLAMPVPKVPEPNFGTPVLDTLSVQKHTSKSKETFQEKEPLRKVINEPIGQPKPDELIKKPTPQQLLPPLNQPEQKETRLLDDVLEKEVFKEPASSPSLKKQETSPAYHAVTGMSEVNTDSNKHLSSPSKNDTLPKRWEPIAPFEKAPFDEPTQPTN